MLEQLPPAACLACPARPPASEAVPRHTVRKLARRSIVGTLRQPMVYVPNLVFPLFLLAVMSGAGDRVTAIEGFPTDSYITFVLGGMLVQSAAGATTMAGLALGTDIQSGFLNRFAMTPVSAGGPHHGATGGVAVVGVVQGYLVLGVGLVAGAHVEAGVGGRLALIGLVCS